MTACAFCDIIHSPRSKSSFPLSSAVSSRISLCFPICLSVFFYPQNPLFLTLSVFLIDSTYLFHKSPTLCAEKSRAAQRRVVSGVRTERIKCNVLSIATSLSFFSSIQVFFVAFSPPFFSHYLPRFHSLTFFAHFFMF